MTPMTFDKIKAMLEPADDIEKYIAPDQYDDLREGIHSSIYFIKIMERKIKLLSRFASDCETLMFNTDKEYETRKN